ncbi:MAG: hypothetical protein SNI70_09770 [Rikenellaceae bacterium]
MTQTNVTTGNTAENEAIYKMAKSEFKIWLIDGLISRKDMNAMTQCISSDYREDLDDPLFDKKRGLVDLYLKLENEAIDWNTFRSQAIDLWQDPIKDAIETDIWINLDRAQVLAPADIVMCLDLVRQVKQIIELHRRQTPESFIDCIRKECFMVDDHLASIALDLAEIMRQYIVNDLYFSEIDQSTLKPANPDLSNN